MNAYFVPTVLPKEYLLKAVFQGWNHNRIEARRIAWPSLLSRFVLLGFDIYCFNVSQKRLETMNAFALLVDVSAELDDLDREPVGFSLPRGNHLFPRQ